MIVLANYVNVADISGSDSPHTVVEKLQRAIDRTQQSSAQSESGFTPITELTEADRSESESPDEELARHLNSEHHALRATEIDSPHNACSLKETCQHLKRLILETRKAIEPLIYEPAGTPSAVAHTGWIPVSERMPNDETPVLILRNGVVRIGERRWERPTWEETFTAFRYWDDPENDGQEWHDHEVTHWMPLPSEPSAPSSASFVSIPRETLAKWESMARVRGNQLFPESERPPLFTDGLADEMKVALAGIPSAIRQIDRCKHGVGLAVPCAVCESDSRTNDV